MKVKAKVLYEESRDGVHVRVVKYEDKAIIVYAEGSQTRDKDKEPTWFLVVTDDAMAIRWGIREFDSRTL